MKAQADEIYFHALSWHIQQRSDLNEKTVYVFNHKSHRISFINPMTSTVIKDCLTGKIPTHSPVSVLQTSEVRYCNPIKNYFEIKLAANKWFWYVFVGQNNLIVQRRHTAISC